MRNSWKCWLAAGVAVLALTLAARPAPAVTPPPGNWAVTILDGVREIMLLIVKVEDKEGKPQLSVVSGLESFAKAEIEGVKGDAKSLHFTVKAQGNSFAFAAYVPKGEAKPKKLLGSVRVGGQTVVVLLDQTDLKTIDPQKAVRLFADANDLVKAVQLKDVKEREAKLRELLKTHADQPFGLVIAETLFKALANSGAAADQVGPAAEQYIKTASVYGPEMQLHATVQVARQLLATEKGAPQAVEYAQKAEKQVGPAAPPDQAVAILKLLARALAKAGKADEVKALTPRIAKLDEKLDEEFAQKAVPFKPEAPAGRKSKSNRVVLVELFTGAQCPPCVSADIAFDAALKAYKPADVALLQYHLHIPGPDPLTNSDTEARAKFYGKEIKGTPTMFLDGKVTPLMGGATMLGKERYGTLRGLIDKALDTDAGAQIQLDVKRAGDKIDVQADISDLKKMGEKVRLRFVLIEDVAHYAGRNGQRLHHHVVRSFVGGVEGFALKEKTAKQSASVDLAELKKKLDEYLAEFGGGKTFAEDERPLRLQHLKVVAFVQDDDSKEVLQAAQADVPAAK